MGWGGVITFICTSSHIWCYVIVWGGVITFICTSSHIWCYVIVWGRVGWGGVITFICTSSHTWCYATVCRLALPHIHDATLLYVVLHFLTCMMLRYFMSSCTSSHTWCYATSCRLALPHIYDATLLCGVGWGGVITFICTSSHIWCYVIVWGGVGWGNNVHLHFLTYMMLRYCVGWGGVITFICTSSHTWCYATVCRLALPHIHDATLLYVVLHFLTYMMLRYCVGWGGVG